MSARRGSCLVLALTLAFFCSAPGRAQDARTVTEPVIPPSCTVLAAHLSSANGTFSDADEAKLDTARIQRAMDTCAKGRAVELRADGAKNAFLSGPLELRTGVVLRIDKGVTLYGSRDPKVYAVFPDAPCGLLTHAQILRHVRGGCRPLIMARNVANTGIMGDGVIDGRGGAKMLGTEASWWEVDKQAHSAGKQVGIDEEQPVPFLIETEGATDFTLYQITLRNAAHFHVWAHRSNGITAWGLKIDTPRGTPNTDGFDPSASTNVTLIHSYIRDGDDNMAITSGDNRLALTGGAGDGPATNVSVIDDHFYYGHGMSIGSNTDRGVSHVLVRGLSIDGAESGIRLKSSPTRGGLVQNVRYDDVCVRGTKEPITVRTDYVKPGGRPGQLPSFKDIVLHNVRVAGGGRIPIEGYDATHRAGVQLDGVVALDSPSLYKVVLDHADVVLGPGPVNLPFAGGKDSTVQGKPGPGTLAGCSQMFVPFPVAR